MRDIRDHISFADQKGQPATFSWPSKISSKILRQEGVKVTFTLLFQCIIVCGNISFADPKGQSHTIN